MWRMFVWSQATATYCTFGSHHLRPLLPLPTIKIFLRRLRTLSGRSAWCRAPSCRLASSSCASLGAAPGSASTGACAARGGQSGGVSAFNALNTRPRIGILCLLTFLSCTGVQEMRIDRRPLGGPGNKAYYPTSGPSTVVAASPGGFFASLPRAAVKVDPSREGLLFRGSSNA
jgi:hypothetical protein